VTAVPRIVVASQNPDKSRELAHLLTTAGSGVELAPGELCNLSAFPDAPPIAETGDSFVENAMLKARGISSYLRERKRLVGVVVLADDSGLEVPALDDRPGIWSARFTLRAVEEGVVPGDFKERYAKDADGTNVDVLLHLLEGGAPAERSARFVCEIALAMDGDILSVFHGAVEGQIADRRHGAGGFGYDPVFYYSPFEQTFGQVEPERKNSVSHRGAALAQAVPMLLQLLRANTPRKL